MEYTGTAAAYVASAGNLSFGSTTAGALAVTDALNVVNMVPLFNMPAEQFATLRTWYGAGYTVPGTANAPSSTVLNGEPLNWYAPY